MARFVPAWQQAVMTALRYTAWEAFKPDEQQAVRDFIAEKNRGDAERAERFLLLSIAQAKPERRMPMGVLILLGALALASAPLLTLAVGTKWMIPAAVLCMVWEVCTAKKRRMRRLWQEREPNGEGVGKALKSLYATAVRSAFKAADRVKLGVMLAATLLLAAVTVLPMLPSSAKDVAARAEAVTAGEVTLADVLGLLPEGREGIDILEHAMRRTAHGSDEEFILAALMLMHREQDPSLKYAGDDDGERAAAFKTLQNTAPGQIDNPEEVAALAAVLRCVPEEKRHDELTRFLQQTELPEGLLTAFGSVMQDGRTLPELLSLCDEIAAAGHDPLAFLKVCEAQLPPLEAAQLVAQTDNAAHRTLLIRAVAPEKLTLDEALAFLRWAKEWGVSAAACYPDGAVLDMDTSPWNHDTSKQAMSLGKRDTFLILRRMEKQEPLTTFTVPEEQTTEDDEELPDALYEDYDPDQEQGAAQYTVVLDTAALDMLPPEHVPRTLDTCHALVFLDTWYVCDGYVRFTRGVADGKGGWKARQIDTPCFAVCQEIAVYSAQNGDWLFSGKQQVVNSPAMLEEDLPNKDALAWIPGDNYIAAPDDAWMAEARADFLSALERRSWRLVP